MRFNSMPSRITRTYDPNLKEQCYMLRKDKQYKSTTRITAEIGTTHTPTDSKFNQEFNINVYRAIGTSKIVVYANDSFIKEVAWDNTQKKIIVEGLYVNMSYDFRFEYLGNEQCKSSHTPIIPFKYSPEWKPNLQLTFVDVNQKPVDRYYQGETVYIQFNLTNSQNGEGIPNKEVHYTLPNGQGATVPTGNDGIVTSSVPASVFNVGLVTINAWTTADETMGDISTSASIGYGVACEILQSQNILINSTLNLFKVRIFDFKTSKPISNDYIRVTTQNNDGIEEDLYPYKLIVQTDGTCEFIIDPTNISLITSSGDILNVYLLKNNDENILQKIASIPVKVISAPETLDVTIDGFYGEACLIHTLAHEVVVEAHNNVANVPVKLYNVTKVMETETDNTGRAVFKNVETDGYSILSTFNIKEPFNEIPLGFEYGSLHQITPVTVYRHILKYIPELKTMVTANMDYYFYDYQITPDSTKGGIYKQKGDPLIFYVEPNVSYTMEITGINKTKHSENIVSIGMQSYVNWDGSVDPGSAQVGLNNMITVTDGRMVVHRDYNGVVSVFTNFNENGMLDTMSLRTTYTSQQKYYPNLCGEDVTFKKVTITYHRRGS